MRTLTLLNTLEPISRSNKPGFHSSHFCYFLFTKYKLSLSHTHAHHIICAFIFFNTFLLSICYLPGSEGGLCFQRPQMVLTPLGIRIALEYLLLQESSFPEDSEPVVRIADMCVSKRARLFCHERFLAPTLRNTGLVFPGTRGAHNSSPGARQGAPSSPSAKVFC